MTLEPCSHQGRTGPCADAVIAAGVATVYAASQDPNPLVSGEGFRKLRNAGISVEMALEFQAEAEKLNEPFFHFMRTGKPLVTLKSALTLDGKIAAPEDNTGWITSERARSHVQQLRHSSDVMLTGIGTVLADNPLLTDRSGRPRSRPLMRVILDSTLRLQVGSRIVHREIRLHRVDRRIDRFAQGIVRGVAQEARLPDGGRDARVVNRLLDFQRDGVILVRLGLTAATEKRVQGQDAGRRTSTGDGCGCVWSHHLQTCSGGQLVQ